MISTQPYGFWSSPISAKLAASVGGRLGQLHSDQERLYWLEQRPHEGGRQVICAWRDGTISTLTPPMFSVRSRVHEYGGGDYTVAGGVIYFVNEKDQRLYRQTETTCEPITPLAPTWRYADIAIHPSHDYAVAVRERHESPHAVINELVVINRHTRDVPTIVMSGHD